MFEHEYIVYENIYPQRPNQGASPNPIPPTFKLEHATNYPILPLPIRTIFAHEIIVYENINFPQTYPLRFERNTTSPSPPNGITLFMRS